MNGSKEKEVKKAKDGAGRGTGKARNPGALSTVRPLKNQEEGGLPSMMWRHKERGAVSVGGQNSTTPVLNLGLICSTVSHLCPEAGWVERGSWNNPLQADCLLHFRGHAASLRVKQAAGFSELQHCLACPLPPVLSHPQVRSNTLRVGAHK